MKRIIIILFILSGGIGAVGAQTYKATFAKTLVLGIGASPTGSVAINAHPLSTPFMLQLPLDDGTPNQVLTTDGAGILSWTTPAGGGGSYINNQTTLQLTANFNIDGKGTASIFAGNDGTTGSALTVRGGNGSSGAGGALSLSAGTSTGTAAGAYVSIAASSGSGTNQNGGTISLAPGSNTGTGTDGFVTIAAGKQLRLNEPSGANYNSFQTASQSVDVNYTLPTTAPGATGRLLSSTTGGAMSWVSPIVFSGGFDNSLGNNETVYAWINERANHNGSATSRQFICPVACTIREIHVATTEAPDNGGGTQSVAFNIHNITAATNSAGTTISETGTVASSTNLGYAIAAGDILVVRAVTSGDPQNGGEYRYIIIATIP